MKHARLFFAHLVITIVLISSWQIQCDEVASGAFGGAATGALIGGVAGGGRGAGIGAGVGLGLGLMSGSAAKSRRQRAERQYETQSVRRRSRQNRNEEYAHEEIIPATMRTEDDPGYEDTEVIESTPIATTSSDDHSTINTASEDTEYKDEEVMPKGIETSYEDEA